MAEKVQNLRTTPRLNRMRKAFLRPPDSVLALDPYAGAVNTDKVWLIMRSYSEETDPPLAGLPQIEFGYSVVAVEQGSPSRLVETFVTEKWIFPTEEERDEYYFAMTLPANVINKM